MIGWRGIRPSSWAIALAAVLLGLACMTETIGGPLERALEPLRFGVHHAAASGRTVVVEMDADSAATIQRWPWPRRNYAAVIDHLREAGAASIVFDVDFSAASDPADDAALAAALARSRGLVALPTFGQQAGSTDRRHLDALPLPAFRPHVALASVSMAPDVDGLVRAMPLATVTAGTPRPSLSAYIAARAGQADATFPVNFSIDPASIPRLGFVAVRDGRFDPAAVRGRNVLIGATAIEMGDRYATTYRGVLPGVIVQALAAETLIAGVPGSAPASIIVALALLLAVPVLRARGNAAIGIWGAAGAALLSAIVLVAQHRFGVYFPLGVGLVMLAGVTAPSLGRTLAARMRDERLTDAATGLPNQRALLANSERLGEMAVVQVNNLDALAAVLGEAADQAIARLAERLRLVSADGAVFRVRGHHLALALSGEQTSEDSMGALRALLLEPVEVGGRKVDMAVSVGVAGDVALADRLLNAAMAAEAAARDGAFWRRSSIDHGSLERSVSLMGELDSAIAAGEIAVHYQPKLDLQSGRIASAEALVRWHHPRRGQVPPDAFIPLAEQTDRIAPLTLAVLGAVLRDVARWRADGHAVTAAVNISAKLLSSAPFNAAIERLLEAAAVPTASLIFEVTESAAMSDPASAARALQRYRDLGIAVSMDDYGTGQSTLTYLRNLPLSELKIDRSFVEHAHRRPADAVLVRSTIDMAHQLGLKVVAEGIEEQGCLDFLRAHGCDLAQGYLISRPLPFEAFVGFLGAADRRSDMAA